MKCGIATITIGCNYGNRLQNLALQEVLKEMGFEVETIAYNPFYRKISGDNISSSESLSLFDRLFIMKTELTGKLYHFRNLKMLSEKNRKFQIFNKNSIIFSDKKYNIKSDLSKLESEYDYVVAGSDQIWNPYWEGANPIYFLQYMPKERRIVYAASFGVSNIPEKSSAFYSKAISDITHLSCRERRGVEIIDELCNRKAIQVIDPTMLLEKKQWESFEKKPDYKDVEKPYVLCYFLGNISHNNYIKMKQYSKNLNAKLLFIDGYKYMNAITASPNEFLYLINHAKLVCTDSFHGCVFSILFEKTFVCFGRSLDKGLSQSMNSRLDSLFELFECGDRYISGERNVSLSMDYSRINEILRSERKKAREFLAKALK